MAGDPVARHGLGRRHLHDAGREEEWTLRVAHNDGAVDRYAEVFAELAGELAP
jgi:hypothetical protein